MGYIKIILSAVILLLGETAAVVAANGGATAGGPAGGVAVAKPAGGAVAVEKPAETSGQLESISFNYDFSKQKIEFFNPETKKKESKSFNNFQDLENYFNGLGYKAIELGQQFDEADGIAKIKYLVPLNPKDEKKLLVPAQSEPGAEYSGDVVKYNTIYLVDTQSEEGTFTFFEMTIDYGQRKNEIYGYSQILGYSFQFFPAYWDWLGRAIGARNYCLSFKNMFLEFKFTKEKVMKTGDSTIRFVDQDSGAVISLADAIRGKKVDKDDVLKFFWLLGYIYAATCADLWGSLSGQYIGKDGVNVDKIVRSDDMKTLGIIRDELVKEIVKEIQNGYKAGYNDTGNRGKAIKVVALRKK